MFSSERARGLFYQLLLLAAVCGVGWYLIGNTLHNLATRQIQVGFDFLWRDAGFEIAESPIAYGPSDNYFRAFLAGLGNTLSVALLGIVLATVLGTALGIARLSSNWLLSRLASAYVETMRNIPLLLQLFVWYGLFTELMPPVRQAAALGGGIFVTQRGLYYPWPAAHPAWPAVGWALLAGVGLALLWRRQVRRRQDRTGRRLPAAWPAALLVLGLPLATWAVLGAPATLVYPELRGFNFQGGRVLSPEFLALLIGLSTYTAAFIAEIVRAGIVSVPRGQAEAAMSLGLTRGRELRLVTLPQALRVIVPPLTSQYLNLTKNSSLAVAIGYLNQTGQAIEAIAILMAVYLSISLAISLLMNWYNGRARLAER